ncbi:MAG: hypothetical protein J7L21_02035 [Sulfurimonas sp.]|nr:hypothetical protein [Sulfurimonas sp.]
MGVVYSLAVTNFTKLSDDSSNLTLLTLKEYLQDIPHFKSVKILCLNDCSECSFYVDGLKSRSVEGFLDRSVKVYSYESSYGFTEVEKEIFFNVDDVEEDLCFSYSVDVNGVGDQVLVEFKDKYYDFSTYFSSTLLYNSMQEVIKDKETLFQEVMR